MFNLFRSQKQAVRLFLGGILLLVAFSMVITLIPGLFSTPSDPNELVLAEVGDEPLTLQEVQLRLRNLRLGGRMDPQVLAIAANNTIDNMITEKVLLLEAEQLGLMPDEEELVEWLKLQLPFLFPNGVFVGRDQYQAFVRQRFERSIPEFEAELRRSLAIDTRLKRLVTSNALVTEEEIREMYRRQNEKAKVEFVRISAEDFKDSIRPTDEEIREYFEANKTRYRAPQLRSVKLMTIDDSTLPEPQIEESEIELYYARNRSLYELPERVHASHILFMTTDKSPEEAEKIEAKANEVLEKIRAGADFAELAKEHSEDPGTAERGGDLDWVTRGQMVKEFEDAVFALEPGEVSGLVKTEFGLHIIKAHARENARLQPLEDVKDQIRENLVEQRRQTERYRIVDEAIRLARDAGVNLEQAGEKLNLPVTSVEKFSRAELPPQLAGDVELITSVFSALEGEVVSSTQENKTVVAVVTEIIPPRDYEFDEIKDSVRQAVVQAEAQRLMNERALEIFAEAKEGKQSLRQVAARYGLKTQTTDFVKPTDTIPDLGPASIIGDKAYDEEPGTVVGPVDAGNDKVIYRVVAQEEADMSGFEDAREELMESRTASKQDDAFNIYLASTRRRYEEAGRIKRYQDRIDAFLQSLMRRG